MRDAQQIVWPQSLILFMQTRFPSHRDVITEISPKLVKLNILDNLSFTLIRDDSMSHHISKRARKITIFNILKTAKLWIFINRETLQNWENESFDNDSYLINSCLWSIPSIRKNHNFSSFWFHTHLAHNKYYSHFLHSQYENWHCKIDRNPLETWKPDIFLFNLSKWKNAWQRILGKAERECTSFRPRIFKPSKSPATIFGCSFELVYYDHHFNAGGFFMGFLMWHSLTRLVSKYWTWLVWETSLFWSR